ncbi:hypothetical protein FAY30_21905 [Bacillus sp. S3]|uniref:hypothetical protein n=1 Tax=Bacillus sp. S3 TaxID=486398 RepID=UPI00118C5D73|nr:hypothetical protein [Bacillus sp. S3]QCJ44344.1 hypothetical protein FAY30_21905 [Bacillus sp. S3]
MKIVVSFVAIFIALSFLLSHTNSYSTAQIQNKATLAIDSEERALIAISYGQEGQISITNHTGKRVEIDGIELMGNPPITIINFEKTNSIIINPGEKKNLNSMNDFSEIAGEMIQINVHWNGGSAKIKSTIPTQNE